MDATSIYSCDDHLDLNAVPRDVWSSSLPTAPVDRGPHVVERDGAATWVSGDRVHGRSGRPPGADSDKMKLLSAIGRAGIEDDGYRAGTPKLRLEDMDRDGIWASFVYGPLSLGFPITDPDLQRATYAAWNDWAVEEFNAAAPERLCAL